MSLSSTEPLVAFSPKVNSTSLDISNHSNNDISDKKKQTNSSILFPKDLDENIINNEKQFNKCLPFSFSFNLIKRGNLWNKKNINKEDERSVK